MIKRYYRISGDAEMAVIEKHRAHTWVHVEAPSQNEIDTLVSEYDLMPGHLEDALDEDEMPRLETEGKQTYAYVKVPLREKDGEFKTIPLLIVLLEKTIISVSLQHVSALDSITSGKTAATTNRQARLVLLIMQRITDQYDRLINQTSRNIKAVRQRLRTHAVTNDDFVDFVTIEDELNEFLSALQPNNATFRRLLVGHRLDTEDQDLVEDVLLTNEQSIEQCNNNIKSIIGVRDAHSSISNNKLNKTMKVLTIATLCIAIPNMFFGLYGMNVDIPLQTNPYVFWVIIGFTAILTLVVYFVGRKKRIF